MGIWRATRKQGTFGCFEVTIGFGGTHRVDYLTYEPHRGREAWYSIWRCYEVKSSKADFESTNGHTFVGHYNYYVLPMSVYEQVRHKIPRDVGAWVLKERGMKCVKRPRRRQSVDDETLQRSLIRSLYREVEKALHDRCQSKRSEQCVAT